MTANTQPEALRTDIEAIRAALADLPAIKHWFVVGPPWGQGDIIVAGHPDPHLGAYVCDTEDWDGDHPHHLEYAAYIAAANPSVVARLLQDFEASLAKVRAEQERAARLHAECEALRADAERYRWLRGNAAYAPVCLEINGRIVDDRDMDESIDAARAAIKEQG